MDRLGGTAAPDGGARYSAAKRLSFYAVFSGLAALVNFGSRFGYEHVLSRSATTTIAYLTAVTLAYLTGMVVNFILSKFVTFQARDSGRTRREAVKFLVIAAFGLGATVLTSYGAYALLRAATGLAPLGISDDLLRTGAHLCGMGLGLLVNFVGHDRFSFRPTGVWDRMVLALQGGSRTSEPGDSE